VQGDPCDALIYTLKKQIATIVLCALPNSGHVKKAISQARRKSLTAQGELLGHAPAGTDVGVDGEMQEELEAGSPQWQAISKALRQHCFRLAGA
jgi:hypothetical protein